MMFLEFVKSPPKLREGFSVGQGANVVGSVKSSYVPQRNAGVRPSITGFCKQLADEV